MDIPLLRMELRLVPKPRSKSKSQKIKTVYEASVRYASSNQRGDFGRGDAKVAAVNMESGDQSRSGFKSALFTLQGVR
jgi:hypothetical protein